MRVAHWFAMAALDRSVPDDLAHGPRAAVKRPMGSAWRRLLRVLAPLACLLPATAGSGEPTASPAPDPAQAAMTLRRACDRGDMAGCARLGIHHAQGRGVPRDFARALELYRRACDGGDGTGCFHLGDATFRGLGVPRNDPLEAVRLFEKACAAGEIQGCRGAAMLLSDEKGVPHDLARAAALRRKACEQDAQSCVNLGLQFLDGKGVPADPAHAAELFRTACDAGVAVACFNLAILHEQGRGVPASAKSAERLLDLACSKGDAGACERIERNRERTLRDQAARRARAGEQAARAAESALSEEQQTWSTLRFGLSAVLLLLVLLRQRSRARRS